MRSHFLSVAATAFVFSSVAYAQSLHDYLVAQKWNAVKSGPLIAIGAKEQWPRPVEGQDQPPATMDSYGRQLVKIGRLTVAAPLSRLDFPDDGLANPYDALTDQDKFIALLGSLNASQWHQLSSGGIAPRDLSGQLKKLLLALIPHPLKAQEFVYGKDGYGSTGEPIPITSEVVQGVKLQLFKALDVGFSPLIDPISKAAMNYGVSSGSYRPPGTHVYRAASNDARAGYGGYAGRFVDNDEKPSQLDYKNPALAKPVAVGQSETVSTLVAKAAQAGGLEIWADARIAKDEVDIFGEQATASELLRGLARAVCGTYRRVGGAYVLTSDLEGLATRGTRALAARALVKLDVQSKVAELRDQIRNQQLFDQVDFLPDDPFQAKTFLVTNRMPTSFYADPGWVSESVMNPSMRNAVPNVNAPGPVDSGFGPGKSQMIPDPALRDKIHLKVTIRYRFILPNGIVLDSEALDPFSNSMISVGPQVEKVTLPLDSSLLKLGSSAGYRSDDPDAVSRFCELAREHGIGEVWIETRRPQVIDAALASGLIIDLVLRPWQILPGERSEIDRTVLGQTGGQLNQIPTARLDLAADQSYFFADSFSPAVDLPDHWTRLLGLASKRGIHRLILMDPIPEGYRHSDSTDYERISQGQEISNGVPVPKNLRDLVPNIGEFGYTTSLRLTCLRKFGVDPIDLEHPFRRGPYSPIPYFGEGQMGQFEYPRMRFGENDELTAFVMIERMRNDLALSALKKAVDRLAEAGHPIWLQYESYLHERHRSPLEFGPSSALTDRFSQERDSSEMITINPLTAEDSSGAWVFSIRCVLDKPMCFDFSDVKLARLPVYFDRVFRKAKN